MKRLFTERSGHALARLSEKLNAASAIGLLSLVSSRIDEKWFGEKFPAECQDGGLNRGCDKDKLRGVMEGYNVIWPEGWSPTSEIPADGQIFDLLEFTFEHVALPASYGFHSYWGHEHFNYDKAQGRAKFTEDVNRIFERQGLAFELKDGEIIRLAPTGLQEVLNQAVFSTGDDELNRLLETARHKFFDRSVDTRKEGLEKLWDAWERLKTVEPGADKKQQAKSILDKAAAEPVLRQRLEIEAKELTSIGNSLMIRHTEIGKPPITESPQVDYLFHRMFAMVRLLLTASGRGG